MTDRTELEEALYWTGREIQEARKALWDGKSGKAFANIDSAEGHFTELEEELQERGVIDE